MAYQIEAICDSCEYSVKGIRIGDGERMLFTCGNCRRLVNPKRVPYRLDCPNCPRCRKTLERAKWIDAGRLHSTWSRHPPVVSEIACPRCDGGRLSFTRCMHMRVSQHCKPPDVGQHVHVRHNKKGCLEAVSIRQRITVEEPVPQFDESEILECVVVSADSKHVVLRCLEVVRLVDLPGRSDSPST